MAKSLASPGTATLAASDLLIQILPRFCTRYHGTAEQLIAEGLIPEGFKWPTGCARVSYEIGKFSFYMGRCRPDGMKGPMSLWAHGDHWFMQRSLTSEKGKGFHAGSIYTKKMELADAIYRSTPEWSHVWHRAYQAKIDDSYMAFRQQLLGAEPRRSGRPQKVRANSQVGQS